MVRYHDGPSLAQQIINAHQGIRLAVLPMQAVALPRGRIMMYSQWKRLCDRRDAVLDQLERRSDISKTAIAVYLFTGQGKENIPKPLVVAQEALMSALDPALAEVDSRDDDA